MAISVFELFKIGIGPSSSHTVGPMVAARRFLLELPCPLAQVDRVVVDLFGSLAMTGEGHGTDIAVLLGLAGMQPATVAVEAIAPLLASIREHHSLKLNGEHEIRFNEANDLIFNKGASLPLHPNGMTCSAFDADGNPLMRKSYFSIGGGFVLAEDEFADAENSGFDAPYDFQSARELLAMGKRDGKSIAEMAMENEQVLKPRQDVIDGVYQIWKVMDACIQRGCSTRGLLPGSLKVKRRAAEMHDDLQERLENGVPDALAVMDWVSLFALAVNEENAAGGKVVTAPTNGAAGVIPAVLAYYVKFVHTPDMGGLKHQVVTYLLTSAAIGMLFKRNASISAAEVGCQGEIGVACSMAAAGLTALMGGTNEQIENAAEIGMEHNLGLTCDPIGGLVQIPCIERNTMGAIKAINASRLALRGDGSHRVSLDSVIETMFQTGIDMQAKYKETAEGGLAINAVNVVEC
ncbi:L-serine ammonia-lyase [Simiduia agarivorans]|uniref:L-serine dehydratase n=1 Tax=Simiduia agarivorans (strain DSM 21679 / JCM 13881 / BCRC 17597 / SA1) TaxID=1117647 RepID=K4KGR3_SIMAS|nr:L-serine ammonia-lyase [Simiduia agarivorans]AFU98289.1 L-serine dehydratase [Simiduia agarivorans SA1 = DSM 21679]